MYCTIFEVNEKFDTQKHTHRRSHTSESSINALSLKPLDDYAKLLNLCVAWQPQPTVNELHCLEEEWNIIIYLIININYNYKQILLLTGQWYV